MIGRDYSDNHDQIETLGCSRVSTNAATASHQRFPRVKPARKELSKVTGAILPPLPMREPILRVLYNSSTEDRIHSLSQVGHRFSSSRRLLTSSKRRHSLACTLTSMQHGPVTSPILSTNSRDRREPPTTTSKPSKQLAWWTTSTLSAMVSTNLLSPSSTLWGPSTTGLQSRTPLSPLESEIILQALEPVANRYC